VTDRRQFRLPGRDPENAKSSNLLSKTRGYAPSGTHNSGPIGRVGQRNLENGWLQDFVAQECPEVEWLIEPMFPKGGIVFLHGPTSVGKSPFTWALATAVSEGTPFFGYPVKNTGPVLYIELDTPAHLVYPRIKLMKNPPFCMWLECIPKIIDICGLTEDSKLAERLHELQAEISPVLVIINTLRKAHMEDDKDSSAPGLVYGAWRHYFPDATLVFVHHNKKTPNDKRAQVNEDQMFSGSQHWADDAQVGLHIKRMKAPKAVTLKKEEDTPEDKESESYQKGAVTVYMTKSQVSDHEKYNKEPLQMTLEGDGTNWIETGPAKYRHYFATLDVTIQRPLRIQMVMEHFDIGKTSAYSACVGMK
jgi:RecA-family ATPase